MLSPEHHALCFFPSPTAPCRRCAATPSPRIRCGERRRRWGDREFDNVEEGPSSPSAAATIVSSRAPRRPAAGVISSPANPFVKHCVKLRESATYRRNCGSALVVGLTPIREIAYRYQECNASNGADEPFMECLLLLDGTEAALGAPTLLGDLGLHGGCNSAGGAQVVRVSPVVMKKLAGMQSTDSTKAVAVMRIPKSFHDVSSRAGGEASCSSWFSSPPHRLLVLDGIQDPGNLGTLLRSAVAFKWDGVFLLPNCCDPFNDKALRAARGASFQLTTVSGDWVHLEALRDKFQMRMLAAHPEDISEKSKGHSSLPLSQQLAESLAAVPLCLALGSEGHGLSKHTIYSSELVHIRLLGNFESLNVSVAGGIFMFTLQTQYCRGI